MSFQVTTAFSQQYHGNVERLLQQSGSRFLPYVRKENQDSENQYFDQVGSVEAAEIVNRHGDSPQSDNPHARRRLSLRFYDVGDYIDDEDKARMLIDPTSTYVQNFVDALNRQRDAVIRDAFFGTANTGKDGSTPVSFPAANIIANDFGSAGTPKGLNVKKLIEARRLFIKFENNIAGNSGTVGSQEQPCLAITAQQLADLLNETQIQSRDYNAIQALVEGNVVRFMGFDFVMYQSLPGGGAGADREIPVWVPSGLLHTVAIEIKSRVAERADKRFNLYAYAKAGFGAARMQENKVLKILCRE